MRFVRLISIAALLLSFAATGVGQDVQLQKSTEKIRIDGSIFYVHPVKKGETVYSLAKAYGISEDELKRANPQLADGLKEGQILRIPEKPLVANEIQKATPKPSGAVEHEVQRKETLYAISRQYNISVDDIKRANPTIDENIKKGQILYIPLQSNVSQQASSSQGELQPRAASTRYEEDENDMAGEHIYHSVKKGETLYSIAKEYAVDEDAIRQLNSDAFKDHTLLEGAILRIPKYEPDNLSSGVQVLFPGYTYQPTEASTPINTYRYNRSEAFNVVFLIPFSEKRAESISSAEEKKQNQHLEFYEGALLAIDTLKKAGLSLNVSTFDVFDSKSLEATLKSADVQQAQLIIAPIPTAITNQLADFAHRRQIPTVLPISMAPDSVIAYNPYLVRIRPTVKSESYKLLENVCQSNRNIILAYHYGGDTTLLHRYKSILQEKGCTYSVLDYTIARSRSELQSMLSNTQENHVIIASANDQPFVINILETLNVLATKEKVNLYIYGSPEWLKMSMNSIQLTYLYHHNLRMAQPFYVDYTSGDTKDFISKYRYYYKGEPGNYAYYGYDISLYFLSCLKAYGAGFLPFLPSHQESLLQSRFMLRQVGYGGMKNEGVFLLEYQPSLDIIRK